MNSNKQKNARKDLTFNRKKREEQPTKKNNRPRNRKLKKTIPPGKKRLRVHTVSGRTVSPNAMATYAKSGLGFAVDTTANLKIGTSVMLIDTPLVQSELVYALLTYASNAFFRDTIGANAPSNLGSSVANFVGGLSYLGSAIQMISKGATAELTDVPEIFDVIIQLLTEKKVKLNSGIIHYTPKWDYDFDLTNTIVMPTGSIYTLQSATIASVIPLNYTTVVPYADGYAELLRVSADDTYGSKIVKLGKNSFLDNDPSCYARSYNYFGASGEVGALYSESELEVPFKYPLFSKFVQYNTADAVVSRVFCPQSGSIVTPVGLSLTSRDFVESQLTNRVPVQYKFLDFNSLYAIVGSWLVALFEATPPNISGNTIYTRATMFPFSSFEFTWLLRQAVLSIFPEQCHSQFVAPVKSSASSSNSVFQPFIVDAITCTSNIYSKMMLPAFIIENLNMLKSRILDVSNVKGKIQRHNWVPVWGVYSGDTVPYFQFKDDAGNMTPLFNPVSTMPFAAIWDGTGSSINTKVNVNQFVPIFLDSWNVQILGYGKRISTKLSPMEANNGSIASLLPYTRILSKSDVAFDEWTKRSIGTYDNPIDEFIINKPVRELKRVTSEKKTKPEAIPPASLFELETRAILSQQQLSSEVMGAINYFLLPSIRLNVSSGDLLTKNAYQIYTGEICDASTILGFNNIAQPEIYRLFAVGTNLSAGLFAAEANNDVLTQAVATMSDKGLGLDFLKALMGGISSVIPVVGPIISGLFNG